MSIKLTDTQLMMLSAAAQRNDRSLVAAPNLKVAAAQKIASKLIGADLAKEIRPACGGIEVALQERTGFRFERERVCVCVAVRESCGARANPSPRRSLRSGARVNEGPGSVGSRNARVQTCPSNSTTSSLFCSALRRSAMIIAWFRRQDQSCLPRSQRLLENRRYFGCSGRWFVAERDGFEPAISLPVLPSTQSESSVPPNWDIETLTPEAREQTFKTSLGSGAGLSRLRGLRP